MSPRATLAIGLFIAALVWLPTLPHPFIADDTGIIATNPILSIGQTPQIFLTTYWEPVANASFGNYRPLAVFTYAVNASLGGIHPWHFRLVNIVLLLATAICVAAVARRWGVGWPGAWTAAMLFALHPLRVEPAVNIVGRAEIMMTLFSLLGLLAWTRWMRTGGKFDLLRVALCFIASVLSKEQGALLAPLLLAALVIRPPDLPRPTRAQALTLLGTLVGLSLLYLAWRAFVLGGLGVPDLAERARVENPIVRHPLWPARLLTPPWLIAKAWLLMWWPGHLQAYYDYDSIGVVTGWTQREVWITLATWLISGIALWGLRRVPGVIWGVVVFLIGESLICNGPVLIGTIFAERLLTLPGVGWALMVGGVADAAWRAVGRRGGAVRYDLPAVIGLALVALTVCTIMRGRVWRDEEVFWRQALTDAPRSIKVHQSLAHLLIVQAQREGDPIRLAEAERLLEEALDIDPEPVGLWAELGDLSMVRYIWADGNARLQLAALEEAAACYEHAALPRPEYVAAHLKLGRALYFSARIRMDREGKEEVIAMLRDLVNEYPQIPQVWRDLHTVLRLEGRADEASALAEEFGRTHPDETIEEP